jgi:hypothetical protein
MLLYEFGAGSWHALHVIDGGRFGNLGSPRHSPEIVATAGLLFARRQKGCFEE